MPTISTLDWVVVVLGSMIAALAFVTVLAFMASRLRQSVRIDLDARLFRISIAVHNDQSRSEPRLPAPDEEPISTQASEKTS
jgi:flagellar biogenesis protein FliO